MYARALALTALAAGATAQSTANNAGAGAQTTITALLGTVSGVAASVVGADACAMTLALACTDTAQCQQAAPTVTITQGPSLYVAAFATSAPGVTGSFYESCALSGTTAAVCHQSLSLSALGASSITSTVTSLAASELNFQPLAITANAGALSGTASGSCTATPTTSSTGGSSGSGGSGSSTGTGSGAESSTGGTTGTTGTTTGAGSSGAGPASTAPTNTGKGAAPTLGVREAVYKVVVPIGAAVLAIV